MIDGEHTRLGIIDLPSFHWSAAVASRRYACPCGRSVLLLIAAMKIILHPADGKWIVATLEVIVKRRSIEKKCEDAQELKHLEQRLGWVFLSAMLYWKKSLRKYSCKIARMRHTLSPISTRLCDWELKAGCRVFLQDHVLIQWSSLVHAGREYTRVHAR